MKANILKQHCAHGRLLNGGGLARVLSISRENFHNRVNFTQAEVETIVKELQDIIKELEEGIK